MEQRIQVKVMCVFYHQGRILAQRYDDGGRRYYRPLGGAVEFGERHEDAMRREIQEELGLTIAQLHFLGVLDSIFTVDGIPSHEVVLLYDAQFLDQAVYRSAEIQGRESDGSAFSALWIDPSTPPAPLYPEGVLSLLPGL